MDSASASLASVALSVGNVLLRLCSVGDGAPHASMPAPPVLPVPHSSQSGVGNPVGTFTYLILCVRSDTSVFALASYAGHGLPPCFSFGSHKIEICEVPSGRATPHQSSRPDVLFLSSRGGRCPAGTGGLFGRGAYVWA